MGDRDDDLEIEVSDLHMGQVADSPSAAHRVGAGAGDRDARLLASRRVRGYAVAGLVLLVCAGLLLSLPGTPQVLWQALAGPTPSPTVMLAPGENQVYFEQTVPWGRLTLDGTPLELQFGKTSFLRRGRHTLTYAAAPWAPLRCQLSVPAQQGDTCPVDGSAQFGNEPLARVVDLGATPERLPEAQRAEMTATVASGLQAYMETTTVLPGDHYRGANGLIAVATMPLRASLALTLNADVTHVVPDLAFAPCVSLCGAPGGGGTAWWIVWAHVVAHWQFMAADGTRIEPGASTDVDAAYPVGITWSGGTWSVTLHPSPDNPGDPGALCQPAFDRAFPDGKLLPSNGGYSATIYLGPDEVEGCVEIVYSLNSSSGGGGGGGSFGSTPTATPTPLPTDAAIFIARLGMVLAGNDVAHTAQPQLPVASTHERALAQQWMAQR